VTFQFIGVGQNIFLGDEQVNGITGALRSDGVLFFFFINSYNAWTWIDGVVHEGYGCIGSEMMARGDSNDHLYFIVNSNVIVVDLFETDWTTNYTLLPPAPIGEIRSIDVLVNEEYPDGLIGMSAGPGVYKLNGDSWEEMANTTEVGLESNQFTWLRGTSAITGEFAIGGGNTDEVTFFRQMTTGSVSGNITINGGDAEFDDVVVEIAGVTTNPNCFGNFMLDEVPAGTHELIVSADGYEPATTTVTVVVGENVYVGNLTLEFMPTHGDVVGKVVFSDGNDNFEDVTVSVGNVISTPDSNGDFQVSVPGGEYDVTAEIEGYETSTISNIVVVAGETLNVGSMILEPINVYPVSEEYCEENCNVEAEISGHNLVSSIEIINPQPAMTVEVTLVSPETTVATEIIGNNLVVTSTCQSGNPVASLEFFSDGESIGSTGDLMFMVQGDYFCSYTANIIFEPFHDGDELDLEKYSTPGGVSLEIQNAGTREVYHSTEFDVEGFSLDSVVMDEDWFGGQRGEIALVAKVSLNEDPSQYAISFITMIVTDIIYGDIDGNGIVQAIDASMTLMIALNLLDASENQLVLADVDGNGYVQAFDASMILQYAVGVLPDFPVNGGRSLESLGDITTQIVGDEIIFTADNVFAFELESRNSIKGYKLTRDVLSADTDSKLAIASAYPLNGEFLRIPLQGNEELKLIINTTEKSIVVGAKSSLINYPNPFNPETTVMYNVVDGADVLLEVYNIRGQLVKTLVSGTENSGTHEVVWNGIDNNGQRVVSGMYFMKLKDGRYTSTKKIILLK